MVNVLSFLGGKIGMLRDFFYFDVSVLVVSALWTKKRVSKKRSFNGRKDMKYFLKNKMFNKTILANMLFYSYNTNNQYRNVVIMCVLYTHLFIVVPNPLFLKFWRPLNERLKDTKYSFNRPFIRKQIREKIYGSFDKNCIVRTTKCTLNQGFFF